MTTVKAFVIRFPVLVFYVLAFAISWSLFLLIGGPGLYSGTDWQSEPRFVLAVMGMLTGPTIASVLLTMLLSGRAGLRDLLGGLLQWRVNAKWYVVALLTAPLLTGVVLFALSLVSSVFVPPIITAANKAAVLLPALGVALTTVLEEIGWTGFATPRLRQRYRIFTTALIVGVLWGVWHLLQIFWVGYTSSAEVHLTLYLPLYFVFAVATLTAYRVLMVWVYDRTESLLVATLMHGSYAACTLPFLSPVLTGTSFLIHAGLFCVVLWAAVAAVVVANHGHLSRPGKLSASFGLPQLTPRSPAA
jgi:membrane protease YdiL (CAAX protease family)